MSKVEASIMKMPENVKLVSSVEVGISDYSKYESKGVATSNSVNWLITAGAVAGFALFPVTSGLFALPVVLAILAGLTGLVGGFFFLADGEPANIHQEITSRSKLKTPLGFTSREGVQISLWTRSAGGTIAQFLLPLRIFMKIKVHQSVTYFPHQDTYVKETHYLTFRQFVKVEEKFDGHRAVFQKAIDSF